MERESFEDKIKAEFEKAEVSPSENVWTNLELELARAESSAMRRRLTFFKMLAAASVVFALAVGAASLYVLRPVGNKLTSDVTKISAPSNDDSSATAKSMSESPAQEANAPMKDAIDANAQQGQTAEMNLVADANEDDTGLASISMPGIEEDQKHEREAMTTDSQLDPKRLGGLVTYRKIELDFPKQTEDPVQKMMARLALREQEIQQSQKKKKDKSDNNESLWTSLGFAAGTFNTVSADVAQPSTSVRSLSSATPSTKNEAKASGESYTLGINVGKKVSDRWIVQGGVNYLTQSSDYTAQAAVGSADLQSFRPISTNELDKMNEEFATNDTRVVTTAPYNVNNNVKYLSVPVQAGYLLINKKFGLQLNAGVSTDLFLQNTKTADSENIDTIDQGIGEDSPYRTMNFSGLMGTELSYKFGQHYRIALNPGLRYPFNSIYKSSLGVESSPLTFDVGLRFRYIFN